MLYFEGNPKTRCNANICTSKSRKIKKDLQLKDKIS